MTILCVNGGSSSLKVALYAVGGEERLLARGQAQRLGQGRAVLEWGDQLEEKLLFPSETQFAIFVQLAKGDTLRLDSVDVRVDGKPAAHYIYSFKELEALQKGGVQRLHIGNIASGEHQVEVSVTGKLANGSDYNRTDTAAFTKEIKPKLLGLVVSASSTSVQDW